MQPHVPHQKGTPGDFGIKPEDAAEMAKHKGDDHLGRPAGDKMLGSGDSVREHGVGATGGHPGKGSGGELDSDFVLETPAPGRIDDPGRTEDGRPNIGGSKTIPEGHVQPSGPAAAARGDHDNATSGGGIANTRAGVTNSMSDSQQTTDDAFAGEITFDEADGDDQREGGGGVRGL